MRLALFAILFLAACAQPKPERHAIVNTSHKADSVRQVRDELFVLLLELDKRFDADADSCRHYVSKNHDSAMRFLGKMEGVREATGSVANVIRRQQKVVDSITSAEVNARLKKEEKK